MLIKMIPKLSNLKRLAHIEKKWEKTKLAKAVTTDVNNNACHCSWLFQKYG